MPTVDGGARPPGDGLRDGDVCRACLAGNLRCTCPRGIAAAVMGTQDPTRPPNMGIHPAASDSADPVTLIAGLPGEGMTIQTSAGGSVGPASNAADEEDQPPSQLRRLDENGGAVPGSQDSELASRAQRELNISVPPPVVPENAAVGRRRSHQQMTAMTSALLSCAQCGPGPGAFQAAHSRGLLQHLCRSHLGQALSAEAVAQLRSLDKVACQICARIRGRTTPSCSECGVATPTRALRLGDQIPDTRRGGVSGAAAAPSVHEAPDPAVGSVPPDAEESALPPLVRQVIVTQSTKELVQGLSRYTLDHMAASIASKYCVAWAELSKVCSLVTFRGPSWESSGPD